MGGISDLFAGCGRLAKAKFLILGSSAPLLDRVRSLNLEHVSPTSLKGPEISRVARASAPVSLRPASAAAKEAATLALMRRWFFARKPDAGFVLTDFPATLLQAKVFDEWLEARDEALNGVLHAPGYDENVLEHYRTLGLLLEADALAHPGPTMEKSA
ncbi:MAG: adenylate kinase [Opitutaceae bacterium]|nr:adenylate kinase [Opitutaceae bacterium]